MDSNPDYKGVLNIDNQPVSYSIWAGPAYIECDIWYSSEKNICIVQYAGNLPTFDRTGDVDEMHVNRCVEYLNDRYGIEIPEVYEQYDDD